MNLSDAYIALRAENKRLQEENAELERVHIEDKEMLAIAWKSTRKEINMDIMVRKITNGFIIVDLNNTDDETFYDSTEVLFKAFKEKVEFNAGQEGQAITATAGNSGV